MIWLKTDNRIWLYVHGSSFELWPHTSLLEWTFSVPHCALRCGRREWRRLRHIWKITIDNQSGTHKWQFQHPCVLMLNCTLAYKEKSWVISIYFPILRKHIAAEINYLLYCWIFIPCGLKIISELTILPILATHFRRIICVPFRFSINIAPMRFLP